MYPIKQVSNEALKNWQDEGKVFQLIDVREVKEHEAFNIGGLLIPLGELQQRINEIDPSGAVVFYCKRGIRSQIAIQRLQRKLGERDFYNLEKGILHLIHS